MYGIYFAIIPALILRVKHTALSLGKAATLSAVWKIFLGYQTSRTILWTGRVLWLSRKNKEPKTVSSEKDFFAEESFGEFLGARE